MATIKSYTDIEQSRELAEILPSETADMYYPWDIDSKSFLNIPIVKDDSYYVQGSIPCWSLAALLGVVPQEIFDGEYIINITEGVNHKWIISYDPLDGISSYLSVSNDNLIDCCVEMIIKLKERNLL